MHQQSKGKTIPVHALSKKVDLILQVLVETKKLSKGTLPEFALKTGININSIKKLRSDGKISKTNAEKIAAVANFDVDDDYWTDKSVPPAMRGKADSEYPGKDTYYNFWYMLRQNNGLSTDLFLRLKNSAPEHLNENLACFNISDTGQSTEFNQRLEILYQVVMDAGYHESGLKYGFSRVRIQLKCEKPSSRIQFTLTETGPVEIEFPKSMLIFEGTEYLPRWRLETDNGILEGEFASKAASLCAINGAEIGDKVVAKLLVRPMDGSLRAASGETMPDNMKRAIIEGLFLETFSEATDGWIVLGSQVLTVVRADR